MAERVTDRSSLQDGERWFAIVRLGDLTRTLNHTSGLPPGYKPLSLQDSQSGAAREEIGEASHSAELRVRYSGAFVTQERKVNSEKFTAFGKRQRPGALHDLAEFL